MSMNIAISATREIFIPAVNQYDTQTVFFDCIQTTTKETDQILRSENPIRAYKLVVLSSFEDEEENEYADDDDYYETPIGTKIVNYGVEHVADLEAWIEEKMKAGFAISIFAS